MDLSVLAKHNLSSYDDEHMVITSASFLPGIYQGRNPIGNGLVVNFFVIGMVFFPTNLVGR